MSENSTENKILEAARNVFVRKGMSGARMQEIADEAGINKALLHYYYRSKEKLFLAIFENILVGFFPRLFDVVNSDLPLEVKLYKVAEKYTELLSKHREMPLFILHELQRNPDKLFKKLPNKGDLFINLEKQLKEEAEKGNIRPIATEMFMMNVVSMLVFPFVARPIYQQITDMNDEQYHRFIDERTREVPRFIMNALRP
jgi:TetR/AcrR family transcriptional regulator